MSGTVQYRVTLSSLAFKSRQYVVDGLAEGKISEVDRDDVARAVRIAKNMAELDYMAIIVAPSVVKVERRTGPKAEWRQLTTAYRLQPGTPIRVWTSGISGAVYMQVVFGSWRSRGDGSQDMYTTDGKRMGNYVASDTFEILFERSAV
jgi:hypothetical protein